MLRDRLNDSLKAAMKARDADQVSILRMINAAIKDKDIAARTSETAREGISDEAVLQLMQSMIKQRRESITLYQQGNRADLVAKEQKEIDTIETYLPKQLSDSDIQQISQDLVKELGASSVKDMGRTMAAMKQRYAGQMDFGKASGIVKALLS